VAKPFLEGFWALLPAGDDEAIVLGLGLDWEMLGSGVWVETDAGEPRQQIIGI